MILFETNPQEALALLRQTEEFWLPTPAIEKRALEVFAENAPKIRAAFGEASLFDNYSGLDATTLNALLEDYARVLLGVFTPLATPAQLKELEALEQDNQLNDLLNIDRWGLAVALLFNYRTIRRGLTTYEAAKVSKEAALEYVYPQKRSGEDNTMVALTTRYQVEQAGLFDYSFFIDAAGGEKVRQFIARSSTFTALHAFSIYYGVWKFSLGKPSRKPKPPVTLGALGLGLAEKVEAYCDAAEKELNDRLAPAKTATATKFVKLSHQSAKLGNLINKIQSRPLEYTNNLNDRLNSRQVLVNSNKDLYPIMAIVQKYVAIGKIPESDAPSPLVINQALGGINMLLSVHNPKPLNGLLTLETTPNEFLTFCGCSPFSPLRAQLLAALSVINDIYIAIFTTRAVIAVKVLTLRKFEQPKDGTQGKLTIDVTEEAVSEGSQSVLYDEYLSWRKALKGASGFRFIHQILTKFNIHEDDLIDQVFGNSYKVREAALGLRKSQKKGGKAGTTEQELTPEQEAEKIRAVQKTNITKQRKDLEGFFETAKQIGLIVWYRRTPCKAAGRKGYIYSWRRKEEAEDHTQGGEDAAQSKATSKAAKPRRKKTQKRLVKNTKKVGKKY